MFGGGTGEKGGSSDTVSSGNRRKENTRLFFFFFCFFLLREDINCDLLTLNSLKQPRQMSLSLISLFTAPRVHAASLDAPKLVGDVEPSRSSIIGEWWRGIVEGWKSQTSGLVGWVGGGVGGCRGLNTKKKQRNARQLWRETEKAISFCRDACGLS